MKGEVELGEGNSKMHREEREVDGVTGNLLGKVVDRGKENPTSTELELERARSGS